jgi:hypothetical protein
MTGIDRNRRSTSDRPDWNVRHAALVQAAAVLAGYETGTCIAELVDCTMDMLAEHTIYMTAGQCYSLEVEVLRDVVSLTYGAAWNGSDGASIEQAQLVRIMTGAEGDAR